MIIALLPFNQYYNKCNYSYVNAPHSCGPEVGNVIETLFYNYLAFMACDGVEPHRGAVEECQDGADVGICW